MAQPGQLAEMFKTVGEQLSGLTSTVGAQGVAKVIKTFDGDCKLYKEWKNSEIRKVQPAVKSYR